MRTMKKNMLAAMMVVSTSFVWAENITVDLTNRNFEIANKDNVSCCAWSSNAEICYENPQNGKACARQKSNGSKWDVIMHTQPFVVEPNTKYRVTVWNRNTLTGGIAKYGIRFVDENMKTMPVKFAGGGYLWRTVKKGETTGPNIKLNLRRQKMWHF